MNEVSALLRASKDCRSQSGHTWLVDFRVVLSLSEPQFAIAQKSPSSPAQNGDATNICFTHPILYSYEPTLLLPTQALVFCSAHMENKWRFRNS